MLIDGNNVTLGKAASVNDYGATVITSTGHMVFIEWTGIIPSGQVYYSDNGCTTNPHLNSGWDRPEPLFGKTVVRLHTTNKLTVPSNVGPNGVSMSVAMHAEGIDNPECMDYPGGTQWGWPLTVVTPTQVGLPATIAAPLRLQ